MNQLKTNPKLTQTLELADIKTVTLTVVHMWLTW